MRNSQKKFTKTYSNVQNFLHLEIRAKIVWTIFQKHMDKFQKGAKFKIWTNFKLAPKFKWLYLNSFTKFI